MADEPKEKGIPPDKFTFVVSTYHTPHGAESFQKGARDAQLLEFVETPYDRPRLIVPNDVEVYLTNGCWVEHHGHILIENVTAIGKGRTPTKEQVEAFEASYIRLLFNGVELPFVLRPGGVFLADSNGLEGLSLKAVGISASVNLVIYPR